MFLGEYQTQFSGRGRVILPKKLREGISGDEIILSKGFEGCIWGFDKKIWEKEAEKQLEVSSLDKKARLLRRYIFSSSITVELDRQGRFVIPGSLLNYAQVKGEVVIIGAGDHFEVWQKSLWGKHLKRIEKEYGRLP